MEKQFVAEEPQQRLVPNRAEAISRGTGVCIIKATTPLGINCRPVGTLRKETGVCLGHRDRLPSSILEVAPLHSAEKAPSPSLERYVVDGPHLPASWAGSTRQRHHRGLVKQWHSQGGQKETVY